MAYLVHKEFLRQVLEQMYLNDAMAQIIDHLDSSCDCLHGIWQPGHVYINAGSTHHD